MSDPGPTLTLNDAASDVWDAVVIGAGPAGATAACALARRGASVLLVEKASFPRDKVCGCGLNGAALAALRRLGLDQLPASLGAVPTEHLRLYAGDRRATLRIARAVAISRAVFDRELACRAIAAGAHFSPETVATIGDVVEHARTVTLRQRGVNRAIRAKVVLAADGLAGTSLRHLPALESRINRASRMGAAAILGGGSPGYESGTIYMACAPHGYVGLVRLEDGRIDIAAALDPAWVKCVGGPGAAAAQVLAASGLPAVEDLGAVRWKGTALLTRRRRAVATDRLFVLGDAAGYVEPFTGEGIAWALGAAVEVIEPALKAIEHWTPAIAHQWSRRHRRLVRRRQLICRVIAWTLRSPALTRAAIGVLGLAPRLADPLVRAIQLPRAGRGTVVPASGSQRT